MKKAAGIFFRICGILVAVLSLYIIVYAFKHFTMPKPDGYKHEMGIAVFCTFITACSAIGSAFLIRKIRKTKHQKIITAVLLVLIGIGMCVSAYFLRNVRPMTDAFEDIDTAYYLLSHRTAGELSYHAWNLGKYGNNYLFILIIRELMKLMQAFRIHDLLHGLMIINYGLVYISLIICYFFIKNAFSEKYANTFLLFAGINPTFYVIGIFIYTITFTMPIMAGLLLFALHLYKSESIKVKILCIAGIAVLAVLGYMIRPTAAFIVIAGVLMLPFAIGKISLKKAGIILATFLIVSSGLFVPLKMASDSLISENVRSRNYPVSYWFLIGSHYKKDIPSLFTGQEDRNIMNSIPDKKQRSNYATAKFIRNYREKTPKETAKMWLEKMALSFSEGATPVSFRCKLGNVSAEAERILFGRYSHIYELYCFVFHMSIFIGIVLSCLYGIIRQRKPAVLMQVTLLGGYVFYMLWETKNIYNLPFTTIMIMLSVIGYESLSKSSSIMSKCMTSAIPVMPALIACFCMSAPVPQYEPVMQSLRGQFSFKYKMNVKSTLTQTFYASQDFTDIRIPVEGAEKENSPYLVQITKITNGKANERTKENEQKFVHGRTVHFKGNYEKGCYQISMKRLELSKKPIKILTKQSYLCDAYDGTLVINGEKSTYDISLGLSAEQPNLSEICGKKSDNHSLPKKGELPNAEKQNP